MKIGIDGRLWSQTGVGRYIRNLTIKLSEIDKDNSYVLFVLKSDKKDIEEKIKNKNWKIVNAEYRWHSIKEQVFFPGVIKKEKLDLMHFPYFSIPVLYRSPYVVTIHDLIFHHYVSGASSTLPLWLLGFKVIAYRIVVANAARVSKKIIAVSEFTKKDIMDTLKTSKSKIEVIYEAADDLKSSGKKEENIKNYFLYVGNVFAHKNVGLLLESFRILSKEDPSLSLVFVGSNEFLYKKLKDHVKKNFKTGSVHFLENVNDEKLSELYKGAIALVRPSLMEGFSLPPLEALENNCLVLASDIPVHHEIFEDGVIYFDHYRSDDILSKMKYVLGLDSQEKEKLIKKGVAQANRYSWKKTALETHKLYESCTSHSV
ncbi:glycosyltransferase family 4 protein [Candidatus Roizmanbacteria bacterium]|nr:glycosyltransferase family 4 protein [Candidatus Roizmanbacteria bacterium]